MDNPEKQGIQHDDIENKNRTQYMMDTTMRKETQITIIKHESSYNTGGKDEPNIVVIRKS